MIQQVRSEAYHEGGNCFCLLLHILLLTNEKAVGVSRLTGTYCCSGSFILGYVVMASWELPLYPPARFVQLEQITVGLL